MRVSELLRDTPITGPAEDFEVTGVTHDSRKVSAGDLYFALEGDNFDGRQFAPQAQSRGAAGIVGRGERPAGLDCPWLSVEEPRRWIGPLAAAAYGHPDRELTTVGVTGTNGKSTTVAILRSILSATGAECAAIGTLGFQFRDESRPAERTTPEAGDLFSQLREVVDGGGGAVAMEVSSHALDLHRVRGLAFDAAVFTNLSRDHLDYHRDLEDYFGAKRKLFGQLKASGRAVVNIGDEYGRRLAAELGDCVTYGPDGEVRIRRSELDEGGIRAEIQGLHGPIELESPLYGRYNLENLLAAVATAEALEVDHAATVEGIRRRVPVTGRMEPVGGSWEFPAFVDFAHTDQALAAALSSLREFTRRKIMLVFGCGGDRDRGKRQLMGRIAGDLADLAIATSDNPRTEDPEAILRQVEQGLKEGTAADYRIIQDRREAIRWAVGHADAEWTLLVAGKGHEEFQILGSRRVQFSDRAEIEQALEERFGTRDAG